MNEMRHLINLVEGRDAPLYHNFSLESEKAQTVFLNDVLPAAWIHNIPKLGKTKGTSFTRNPRLEWGDIRLKCNQAKLAYTHKIIPLDGQVVFSNSVASGRVFIPVTDRGGSSSRKERDTLAEEFVLGDIKPLHDYLIDITVQTTKEDSTKLKELLLPVLDYAYKWKVPVSMPTELVKKNLLKPDIRIQSTSLFSDSELQQRYPNGLNLTFYR